MNYKSGPQISKYRQFLFFSLRETARLSYGYRISRKSLAHLKTSIIRSSKDPNFITEIAIEADSIVGTYWIHRRADHVFLLHFFIPHQLRRRGFGSEIWSRMIVRAEEYGMPVLKFAVSARNTKALGFYARNGAHITDTEMRGGMQWFEMEAQLQKSI